MNKIDLSCTVSTAAKLTPDQDKINEIVEWINKWDNIVGTSVEGFEKATGVLVDNYKEEHEELKELIKGYRSRNIAYIDENAELSKDIKHLNSIINGKINKIKQLKEYHARLREENARLKGIVYELKKENSTVHGSNNKLLKEYKDTNRLTRQNELFHLTEIRELKEKLFRRCEGCEIKRKWDMIHKAVIEV